MTLEEYKNILITGTPSDRARAIAEAGNDRSLTDEEFHELTAMIKGVVRPGRRKMTPDEAKLWAEVSRINTRLKNEMVNAGFAVRALPGDLQEDAINVLSRTVSGMLGDLTAMMAETGSREMDGTQCVHVFEITRSRCLSCGGWAAPGLTGSPDGRSCWAARAWLW